MVLRKNEYLIRKRSATQAIHILPKKKKPKKKYTADPNLKKKRQYDFYYHIQEMFYMTMDLWLLDITPKS